jgi:two-component system, NarL family, response regulator DevR
MTSNVKSRVRLLLVDDHPIVRAGLHTIHDVAPHLEIVGEASTATEAIEKVIKLNPDIVLMDLRLPDGNGIDVCRRIKSTHPNTRVLCLTSYVSNEFVLSAVEAGADGYLLKESDANRIVDAIETVLRGGSVFDPTMARRPVAGGRKGHPSFDVLTGQERRVLEEVATGKTDKEVAVTLRLSAKTVRNYLDRIFDKLEVNTRTQAAMRYARSESGQLNEL